MKSLKMKVEEAKTLIGDPKEVYPYGLVLRLEKAQIEALGMKELPDAGAVVEFEAKAKVVKVEMREEYTCVELQVTDMELEGAGGEKDFHDME